MKTFILQAAATVFFAGAGQAGIVDDDFTAGGELDASHWATQSDVLTALAAHNHGLYLTPALQFGSQGMEMSGVTGRLEFAGISSVETFTAPFTLSVTVEGVVANGNAFAVFLVAGDMSRWFSIQGNLNAANRPYYGIRLASSGSVRLPPKHLLCKNPGLNVPYTIRVTIDSDDTGSLWLMNGSEPLAFRSGVQLGSGPFHLVLAQREGLPHTVGPNVAIWKTASITPSIAWSAVRRENASLEPGSVPPMNAFRPSFHDLIIGAQYQLQVSSNLCDWLDSGEAFTATNTRDNSPQVWNTADAPHLFFRLKRVR